MSVSEADASAIQQFLAGRLGLHVKIGERTYPRGSRPLYLWRCRDCGALVKGTPQGHGEYLHCPKCAGRDEYDL